MFKLTRMDSFHWLLLGVQQVFVGKFGGYQRLQNISRQTTSNQVYTGFNIH
jgi:hypothetical protein